MTTDLVFSDAQKKIILDTYMAGASEQEAAVLLEVARRKNLDPFLNQIYFVKRWDDGSKKWKWSFQVSIDGLRAVAERTGNYAGQGEPIYEYEADGTLKSCKVSVYRKGWDKPCVGVAFFKEYCQYKKEAGADGKPVAMALWGTKPHVMLAKTAEAQALRKAFPLETGGLYATEEMPEVSYRVSEEPAKETLKLSSGELSDASKALIDEIQSSETIPVLDALIPKIKALEIGEPERAQIRAKFLTKKSALGSVK